MVFDLFVDDLLDIDTLESYYFVGSQLFGQIDISELAIPQFLYIEEVFDVPVVLDRHLVHILYFSAFNELLLLLE